MNAEASKKEVRETDCQQLKMQMNSEGSWRHEHNRRLAFIQAQKVKITGMLWVARTCKWEPKLGQLWIYTLFNNFSMCKIYLGMNKNYTKTLTVMNKNIWVNKVKLHFEKAREMQVTETQIRACPLIWIRKLEVKLKEVNFTKRKSPKGKDMFIKAKITIEIKIKK